MILEDEPVDIYTANPTTHSERSDKTAPSVAWTACNTAACVQQSTPGISLLLFVLEWPSCWAFSCTACAPLTSYPTTLYQTQPNKTQANIM